MQTSKQLLEVFGELKHLLAYERNLSAKRSVTTNSVSAQQVSRTFEQLKSLIEADRERFSDNPWIMAGLGRYEVRNCAVLAQLWDRRIVGTYGLNFLAAFVDQIREADSALPTRAELEGNYVVRTEHCPNGMQSDRVDITVEGANFLIGIEAKIDADVRDNQLEDYCAVMKARAAGLNIDPRRSWVIFLTTDGRSAPGVISASWRDIAAAARQCQRDMGTNYRTQNWLAQRFADHLAML